MAKFDVRSEPVDEIDQICFSDSSTDIAIVAHTLQKNHREGYVEIIDGPTHVLVSSAEHADNLIKALKKAKELGWLK